MDDFELLIKNEFLDEAAQSLADSEQCFLALESNPSDFDNINKIFRLAHNLKGSSKAVGFVGMNNFTHEFESLILKMKNGQLECTPEIVSLLLRCNDYLIQLVDHLKQDLNYQDQPDELVGQMQHFISGAHLTTEPETTAEEPHEQFEDSSNYQNNQDSLASAEVAQPDHHTEATQAVEIEPNLELLKELLGHLPDVNPTVETKPEHQSKPVLSVPENITKTEATPSAKAKPAEESIRISLSKLESLLNYVGEISILQSVLNEQAARTNNAALRKTVNQMNKVSKEVQNISMSLRMVPIKPTFQKMQRIVRDTALALNKEVRINLVGEDTELDKTVLERINDPLVHLIRNSVDHGIESPEIRKQKGKPETGVVSLSATQKSGKLLIEVRDDGAGLNPEKLKQKAIEKGVIKANAQLTEKEIYNLIFAPGFSTKEQVTDVSGRGVGMDVVKTNIQELSGEIQIESVLGEGTTFKITLPLSLAIIDGMVILFNENKFVVPLTQVHETLRPSTKQLQFNQGVGCTLILRGENIPIYKLGDFFAQSNKREPTDMIALVVRTGARPYALLVDDILGQYQVVTKKLDYELAHFKGVSGSTILGDGKPTLIIDPNELVKRNKTVFTFKATNIGGLAS